MKTVVLTNSSVHGSGIFRIAVGSAWLEPRHRTTTVRKAAMAGSEYPFDETEKEMLTC